MVSVIITTYNYAHFLTDAVNSIRDQIFTEWECIVVDSGSADNTKEFMEKLCETDRRFSYIQLDKAGVSAARNAGVENSHGELLQFLDGDDMLQRNKISSQVRVLQQNLSVDIVYGDVRFFDDGNQDVLRSSLRGNKKDDWLPKISGRGSVIVKHLRSYNFLVTPSPLIRRSAYEKAKWFDEKMQALEDWDFWLRIALNDAFFEFHSDEDDLALIRVHKNSLSRKKDLMRYGNFQLLQKAIFNWKAGFGNKNFFLIKYLELFWDTVFSKYILFPFSFPLFIFSIIAFPLWIIIKIYRLIRRFI